MQAFVKLMCSGKLLVKKRFTQREIYISAWRLGKPVLGFPLIQGLYLCIIIVPPTCKYDNRIKKESIRCEVMLVDLLIQTQLHFGSLQIANHLTQKHVACLFLATCLLFKACAKPFCETIS